jgi:hypothetical protein
MSVWGVSFWYGIPFVKLFAYTASRRKAFVRYPGQLPATAMMKLVHSGLVTRKWTVISPSPASLSAISLYSLYKMDVRRFPGSSGTANGRARMMMMMMMTGRLGATPVLALSSAVYSYVITICVDYHMKAFDQSACQPFAHELFCRIFIYFILFIYLFIYRQKNQKVTNIALTIQYNVQ